MRNFVGGLERDEGGVHNQYTCDVKVIGRLSTSCTCSANLILMAIDSHSQVVQYTY